MLAFEKEITRHQNTSTGRGASSAVQEQQVVKGTGRYKQSKKSDGKEERDSCQAPSHQKYETSKHDVRATAEVEEEQEPDAGHAAFRRRRSETGFAASCAN